MMKRLENWVATQREIRALQAKSDRLLADIGIERDDIPTIVRKAKAEAVTLKTEPGLIQIWFQAVTAWVDAKRVQRAEQRRYERELNAYSNGDLADLGINRLEIQSLARRLAFKTKTA